MAQSYRVSSNQQKRCLAVPRASLYAKAEFYQSFFVKLCVQEWMYFTKPSACCAYHSVSWCRCSPDLLGSCMQWADHNTEACKNMQLDFTKPSACHAHCSDSCSVYNCCKLNVLARIVDWDRKLSCWPEDNEVLTTRSRCVCWTWPWMSTWVVNQQAFSWW